MSVKLGLGRGRVFFHIPRSGQPIISHCQRMIYLRHTVPSTYVDMQIVLVVKRV